MTGSADRRRRASAFTRVSGVTGPAVSESMAACAAQPPTLWRAFAGFGLWAVCFTVLYTGHALGCTWIAGSSADAGRLPAMMAGVLWLLAAIWVFFVLWLIVLALRSGFRVRAVHRCLQMHRIEQGTGADQISDSLSQAPGGPEWTMIRRRSLWFMVVLTFAVDICSAGIILISGLPIVFTPVCQ